MEQEITKLTRLWYQMVGLDHHKDRDCHWQISKVWSYSHEPAYNVEHYGYIGSFEDREFETHKEASEYLLRGLRDEIDAKRDWANSVLDKPDSWDEYLIGVAKGIKELTKKI